MTAEVDERGKKLKRFDVTETQAYKDLYANNLRMYSFLMTKEMDRKKHERLRNRKEEYFQNHVATENNQRNNRLLKSFKQMSRMRTCLSDLDLSRISDSDSENSPQANLKQRSETKADLHLSQNHKEGGRVNSERPRSWTALDNGSPKLPRASYFNERRSSAGQVTTPKYLAVPSGFDRAPSPLTSPESPSDPATFSAFKVSPTKQTYIPALRRHFSDLGDHRNINSEICSDSDATNSDSETSHAEVNGNENRKASGSPSLQRARQARIRQEYRKARIASLEGEISKANSVLKDIKKKAHSLPKEIPENRVAEFSKEESKEVQ
eukprot:gene8578-14586_t